jgi:hypothetical protein
MMKALSVVVVRWRKRRMKVWKMKMKQLHGFC